MALSQGSRRFLIFLLVVGVLVVGVVGGGLWWVDQQLKGDPGPGDPVEIEVASGASAASIGDQLAEAEVVKNALAFRLVARSRNLDQDLVAGTYDFETGMSVDEAIDVLLAGPKEPETFRVTIPEGLTVAETLDRLAAATPYSADDFRSILDDEILDPASGPLEVPDWVPAVDSFGPDIEPFEGLLFPQTYEFAADASATSVLQRLLDETASVMAGMPADVLKAATDAGLDRYQALIIASLVEREAKVDSERPTIAAVIRNRLAKGMLLQIDATVQYARGEHTDRVLSEDTSIESPYNTYKVEGLPPTPIAGARKAAIEAALKPADVPYLYYVVSPACDGSHNFAETLDQHNANVAAYRASDCAP